MDTVYSQGMSVGEDIECRAYHTMNITDKCSFINSTADCSMDDGFINYLSLLFCALPPYLEVFGLIVMFVWWLVLFVALATTADKFFCPSLAVISTTLRLSDNLAGVTFLAFGNGAPDIFSSISAVGSVKGGDVGLAFGALLGAGVYVTAVVSGAIAVARPFKAMERPLLKDIIFYLAAVFWTFTILYKGKIYLGEAIGFIGLYVFYVFITLLARAIYQRHKRRRAADMDTLVTSIEENNNSNCVPVGNIQEGVTTIPVHQIVLPSPSSESGSPSPTGSVRSRVGIMTPNYMMKWAVAHDYPDTFGDRHSRRHHSEEPQVPKRQRTQSLTECREIPGRQTQETERPIVSHSYDVYRPRALSDIGPSRIAVAPDFAPGLDNPAFVENEEDTLADTAQRHSRSTQQPPHFRISQNSDYTVSLDSDDLSELPRQLALSNVAAAPGTVDVSPEMSPDKVVTPGAWKEFLLAVTPIDLVHWNELSVLSKAYEILKAPVLFLLLIVTPVVDSDLPKDGWNKYRTMLNVFLAPNFFLLGTKVSFMMVEDVLPVGVIVFLGSLIFPIVVFFTSKPEQPPIYHPLMAFLGFVTSILWIYCIANEIVNILETWGIFFNISNVILGLTFLAWGNSIGDTISNVVVAREGYPRMAISACFGGPLFNLLLGIGLPFTIQTAKNGGVFVVQGTTIEYILVSGVTLSLLSTLIYLIMRRFYVGRVYGCYLFILYATFLLLAILTETGVIKLPIGS